jgi:hypothetical protein
VDYPVCPLGGPYNDLDDDGLSRRAIASGAYGTPAVDSAIRAAFTTLRREDPCVRYGQFGEDRAAGRCEWHRVGAQDAPDLRVTDALSAARGNGEAKLGARMAQVLAQVGQVTSILGPLRV